MTSSLVLTGILILLVLIGIMVNNAIIARYNRVKQAWSDVVTQERQKSKIIPKVEELVQAHKEFESATLASITEMRSAYKQLEGNAENITSDDLKSAMNASKSMMGALNVTVEAYPELKSHQLYQSLATEIVEQEENIAASIRIYNSNVATFNTGIEIFPNSLINTLITKKTAVDFFQNEDAESALGFSANLN